MLFDLITAAKLSIKIECPNKILLFIENLCFCSLKILGASKNYRLKITEWSKNYGLKIPVRVRVYARIYARVYDCQDSTGHTTRTRTPTDERKPPEKGGHRQSGKPAYICMIMDNEKKYKKVKKNL